MNDVVITCDEIDFSSEFWAEACIVILYVMLVL